MNLLFIRLSDLTNMVHTSSSSLLEHVRRDEQGHLGQVAAQQVAALQLAHLHLGLQRSWTFDGCHQEKGAGLLTRALHAEVSPAPTTGQSKAQRVTQHPSCRHPKEDSRGGHVGNHSQEVERDGIWSLAAGFVFLQTWVPLTAPGTKQTFQQWAELQSQTL